MIVVARYTEDTSWADGLDAWIVQKDTDLPNRGREPSSFVWAILQAYERLEGTWAFVQGNPFDHCPDLLARINDPVSGYVPLGSWHTTSDAEGRPHHLGVPVGMYYEAWLGRPFPGEVRFTAGGQFMVTADVIRKHPREFYQRLYDDLMRGGLVPYAAERLWPVIFS